MSLSATIARYKRELRADPNSMRFVPLAEALRKAGRVGEAENVLADGLLTHPGLNSARLVLARVYADTERKAEALAVLDELYPRDAGNVSLVGLYLEMLVEAGRADEARVLLDRAELVGVPLEVRQRVRDRLEVELWAEREADAAVITPAGRRLDARDALGEPVTLPDTNLSAILDRFAVPAVADRLERAGRLDAALRIWEELSLSKGGGPEVDRRIAHLRLTVQHSSVPLDPTAIQPLRRPAPGPKGRAALLRLRERLQRERS